MRKQIAFMITLSSLSSLGVGLLGPIYPIYILNRFSASIVDLGLLLTIFGIASAIFKVIAGKMIDVYGKETILLVGGALGAVCSLAYIFVSNLIQLYIVEFAFGVSYALQDPARLAIVTELGGRRKGFMIGISESAYEVACSLAALIAVAVVSNFGFEPIFFICSGCQASSGLVVLKYPKILRAAQRKR